MKRYKRYNKLKFQVFNECDIIYLCVQPHHLDLILREVSTTFSERMERVKKRKFKLYPVIISLLSGITYEKLRTSFSDEITILRTSIVS